MSISKLQVEEELPLKQGLKLFTNMPSSWMKSVEEELPLKQGLKHVFIDTVLPPLMELKRNFH